MEDKHAKRALQLLRSQQPQQTSAHDDGTPVAAAGVGLREGVDKPFLFDLVFDKANPSHTGASKLHRCAPEHATLWCRCGGPNRPRRDGGAAMRGAGLAVDSVPPITCKPRLKHAALAAIFDFLISPVQPVSMWCVWPPLRQASCRQHAGTRQTRRGIAGNGRWGRCGRRPSLRTPRPTRAASPSRSSQTSPSSATHSFGELTSSSPTAAPSTPRSASRRCFAVSANGARSQCY
jgi:hypothetical protein